MKHILILPPNPCRPRSHHRSHPSPSLSQIFLKQLQNKSYSKEEFVELCRADALLGDLVIEDPSFLSSVGLDWMEEGERVFLASSSRRWRDQLYCFVDIESTDANPEKGNVLELGAILCDGYGRVKGRFESYVRNECIPEIIQEITGIGLEDVQDAPEIREVLAGFRAFLGQAVFVAHNADFDYLFLDHLFYKHFGIGLYNQRLCTIKMAKRLICSPKFSLSFLNAFLGIHTPISHRAYADAYTCKEVFFRAADCLPIGIKTTQDLMNYVAKGQKEREKSHSKPQGEKTRMGQKDNGVQKV